MVAFVVLFLLVLLVCRFLFRARTGPRGGRAETKWIKLRKFLANIPGFLQTLLSFIAFMLFMFCFVSCKQACAVPKAMTAFMEGVPAPPTEKCFQNRTHLLPASLLRPAEDAEAYYLVEGPHGCGKTTIIRDACHSIGPGVMYVSVPPAPENFGEDLANLIHFDFTTCCNF